MSASSEKLLKWLPVAVLAAGLVASVVRAEGQINTNSETIDRHYAQLLAELADLSESGDENEEELVRLRLLLLEQQRLTEGEVKEMQGDIKLILRLLEEQTGD